MKVLSVIISLCRYEGYRLGVEVGGICWGRDGSRSSGFTVRESLGWNRFR